MQMGHGWPPIDEGAGSTGCGRACRSTSSPPCRATCSPRCARAFAAERARVNAIVWQSDDAVPEDLLTARQMLEMATINGAHVAGLEDRTGSLTPGKKADVVADRRHGAQRRAR